MILTETPRRKMVTKLVTWGHWFAFLNIVIAIVIASIYVFNSPSPETALGTLYLFSNWFSHIGFLTFFGFVIFILPLCYLLPKPKVVKGVSSVMAAISLALLAFDALLYTKYGLHLSFGSAELIRNETQTVMAQFNWQQWGFLLLLFIVWLSLQLMLANALWQRIERTQKLKLGLPITAFFVLCFVTSHAIHIWADANLYHPIVQQDDMFPLSYPATAKTLMARYDLLDYENYYQRRELQFEQRISTVTYPAEPVYCAVSDNSKVLLILLTEALPDDALSHIDGLKKFDNHYDLSSSLENAIESTLFGLPELYQSALHNKLPLLLEMPSKLGLEVLLYSEQDISHRGIDKFRVQWQGFQQSLVAAQAQLAIAVVNGEQLKTLLSQAVLTHYQVVVSQLHQQDDGKQQSALYSNVALQGHLSSNEDLAPTLLNIMGCGAEVQNYSTGRNMLQPHRNWLVTTHGNTVIVLNDSLRIEVMNNGNHKIFNRLSGEESIEALNTGLLSQAIKHLSRFADIR